MRLPGALHGDTQDARPHPRMSSAILHARNIALVDGRLLAFDCIEFEPAFRWIDVAEEIALLLADLNSRDCSRHAHAFLSGYLAESGDYRRAA